VKVSVIATVFNEAGTIGALLSSLANQTRPPDEIVIADAGSTDGTRELLIGSSLPQLRVVDAPGNRSVGRNAAISASGGDVIATIDAGCAAEPEWLDRLVAPFANGASWVAGFYRPEGSTDLATCIGLVLVYVEEEVRKDPDGFLPSARSMAFTRDVWKAVGGFPEHVDFAEDTLYGESLMAAGLRPIPALDAIVQWTPPPDLAVLARTAFRWGNGDAHAGIRGWTYKRILVGYGGAAAVTALTALFVRGLVWLGPLAVLIDTLRRTRYKYQCAPKPSGWVLVPIAHIVSTYSSLVGFLTGYVRRRQRDLGL
jgi:cellulose synthase/poly-beta-1,6-N-acetylglucosamine synthase-like glycosyltransferase